MPPSESYENFIRSVHDSGSSRARHESYDLTALRELTGDELAQAEELLLQGLADGKEDPRVVSALMALGPSPRGKAAMKDALDNYLKNYTCIALARGLWQLEQSPKAMAKLIEMATTSPFQDRRMTAVNALGEVSDPAADEALLYALREDKDELIPFAAKSRLYTKYKLDQYQKDPAIRRLNKELKAEDPAVRQAAHSALADLIKAVRGGKTPEELGLSK